MDPLTIIGGAAALTQLSSLGCRFARGIYRFAKDAGAASAEIERFGNHVQASSSAIELALIVLRRYCADHPTSALVSYISAHKIFTNIDWDAALVLNRIRTIKRRVASMVSRSRLWTSIKWSLDKASILELCPEIERIKSSLTLLMTTAQFHALVSSRPAGPGEGSDDRIEKELRALRHAIKHQLRIIVQLNSQLSRGPHPDINNNNTSDPSLFPASGQQEALMDLGWSMYEHGKLPESFTSPAQTGLDGQEPNQSWATGSLVSLDSTSSSSPLPDSPGDVAPEHNVPEPRPFSKRLSLATDYFTDRTNGYIAAPSGSLRHATAVLVRTLDGNVISARRAARLGLHVRPLGPTDGVVLEFGTRSPERSIGRVTFQWRRSKDDDPRYPPLTVDCDVCEDYPEGLILGKPFLREKARRWSGKEGAA